MKLSFEKGELLVDGINDFQVDISDISTNDFFYTAKFVI